MCSVGDYSATKTAHKRFFLRVFKQNKTVLFFVKIKYLIVNLNNEIFLNFYNW